MTQHGMREVVRRRQKAIRSALLSWVALISFCGDRAGSAEQKPIFAGKTISIIVGSAAGGAFDSYARLLARHYGDHLPGNPSIVVRNMPGAASMSAAEHIYNVSAKDGTEIGELFDTAPLTQLLDPKTHHIDPTKLGWIGTINSATNVLVVWGSSGVKSIDDARKAPVSVGSTSRLTQMDIFPRIANEVAGSKFEVVNGYEGAGSIDMAMQHGEIQGVGSVYWASYAELKPDWVTSGKVVPLFQVTFQRDKSLPNVPTLMELAKTETHRQLIKIITETAALGAPLIVAPGTPAPILDTLRQGFDATMQDESFLADAQKVRLDTAPTRGVDLAKLVEDMMSTPPGVVAQFRSVVDAPPL